MAVPEPGPATHDLPTWERQSRRWSTTTSWMVVRRATSFVSAVGITPGAERVSQRVMPTDGRTDAGLPTLCSDRLAPPTLSVFIRLHLQRFGPRSPPGWSIP